LGNEYRRVSWSENDIVILEETFDLVDGENVVEFNWEIPVGNDWSIRSPQTNMYRNNGGISYPYAIGDAGTIYTSNFGSGWYYYFYDWHIQKETFTCESEALEVAAIVGINEIEGLNGLELYPNPVNDNLNVSFNLTSNQDLTFNVIDATGKVVLSQQLISNNSVNQVEEINVSGLASGVYSLQILADNSEISRVFVKN